MNFDMEQYLKKTEEFKNYINRADVQFRGLTILQSRKMLHQSGQKIVFETKKSGLEIACSASKIVTLIGFYEMMKAFGLEESLNMLAAIHGLKETGLLETLCACQNCSSTEEMEVMSALLNKSPEEIEKLKEQLNE